MAQGLFTLRQQVQGIVQKAWNTPVGTYAGSFNGSSQYLTVPYSSAFNFGTGDFTIEGWINLSSLSASYYVLAGTWTTGTSDEWLIQIQNNNTLRFLTTAGTSFYSATITTGVWYHIAGVRSGSTITLYVNGASVGSYTNSNSIGSVSKTVYIGAQQTPVWYTNGYISNFRIVNGTALYTSNFAIPSAPLRNITNTSLLTLQNSTIIDNSTNAFTITNVGSVTTTTIAPTAISVNGLKTPTVDYLVVAGGGSGKSDGYGGGGAGGLLQGSVPVISGSSITVTVGAGGATGGGAGGNSVFGNISALGGAYAVQYGPLIGGSGAGPFNWTGTGSEQQSFSTYGQGNDGGLSLITSPSGSGGGGAGTKGFTGTSAGGGNGGAGIASAISGTVTTYAGGGGGGAYGVTTNASGGVGGGGIGSSTGGSSGTSGQTNTGGGGGSGNNAGGSGIVIVSYPDIYAGAASTTGSPTVSTSGSGSILFSGTTDNIYAASNAAFAVGTNNFTVEFWANWTAWASTNQRMILMGQSGSSPIAIYRDSASNVLGITINGADKILYTWTPALNTWYHVAVVRSGTSTNQVTLYINGTNVGTGTSADSIAANNFFVGGLNWASGYNMQGYMSNVRFVNGTAVYTGNFTPSTTPLTPITNTSLLLNTVSGAQFADSSTNSFTITRNGTPAWNQASPFGTGLGYKNRVYTWTSSGSITF